MFTERHGCNDFKNEIVTDKTEDKSIKPQLMSFQANFDRESSINIIYAG